MEGSEIKDLGSDRRSRCGEWRSRSVWRRRVTPLPSNTSGLNVREFLDCIKGLLDQRDE